MVNCTKSIAIVDFLLKLNTCDETLTHIHLYGKVLEIMELKTVNHFFVRIQTWFQLHFAKHDLQAFSLVHIQRSQKDFGAYQRIG